MTADLDGERILIIEDDDSFREDLTLALDSEGYAVVACASGLEAVEVSSRQTFDLVVSDVRMAGMDGLETLERLQQKQPEVATLVMTGYTAEVDSIRAVRLGVGDYLKKPFRLDEFLSSVARLLSRHRARQLRGKREENLRKTGLWALEQLAPGANQEAQMARLVALELGLSDELAADAQLAVLLSDAGQRHNRHGLPPDVLGLLEDVQAEQAESLVGRVAQTARRGQSQDEALGAAWSRAQQRGPSSRDGELAEARRRRSLVLFARSHEHAGQSEEARAAYQSLVEPDKVDREGLEALLGLVRLQVGDPPQCRARAQEAMEMARQLNPLLSGVAALEAGLYLAQAGLRSEALGLFEQALRVARSLNQVGLEARSVMALAGSAGEVPPEALERALKRFGDSEEYYELVDSAWWLVPCLLRLQVTRAHPLQEKVLQRLGRETPAVFRRLVQGQRLDVPARLCAIQSLRDSSHPVAQETLKLLRQDPDGSVRQASEQVLRETSADPVLPTVRIYSLGGFELYRGEERVPDTAFRSAKQRFLLARLAGSAKPLQAEKLVDEFWPDDAEGGRLSLNAALSQLRKALKPPQWHQEVDYVLRDVSGVRLNPDLPIWHDWNELQLLAAATGSEEEQVDHWRRAVQLYRGPYLENCYMDWAAVQRERAEVIILDLLHKLVEHFLKLNRAPELLDYGTHLVKLDPCSQEGHLSVMRAHLLMGRPELAVRQFETCKKTLRRELAMEPSIALLEAHQRALLSV